MADSDQLRDAGRRLATDLRDLKKARNIPTEEILKATRLTEDIFRSFDESALVDHPAFNRVYLRSVVASYARVLRIDAADALDALDAALEGKYDGALWRKYLREEDRGDGPSFSLYEAPVKSGGSEEKLPAVSPDVSSEEERENALPEKTSGPFHPVLIVVIILLAVLAVWLIRLLAGGFSPSDTEFVPQAADSIERPIRPEPVWIALGDSIRFDIVARDEALDPVRIKVDDDMRRPYWIEHLDTLTFFAFESILFERELEVADILMDGRLLSDSLIDADGRLEMNRSRARAWLDTLAVREAARQ